MTVAQPFSAAAGTIPVPLDAFFRQVFEISADSDKIIGAQELCVEFMDTLSAVPPLPERPGLSAPDKTLAEKEIADRTIQELYQ
jgi:hypothetical protein